MNELARLIRYNAWADGVFFEALSKLPPELLSAPQPIIFGSIVRTLNHVHAMDRVWRAHLEGRPHGYTTRNPVDCPAFGELRRAQAELDQWFVGYVDALPRERQSELVEFTFIGGGDGAMTRAEILLHVVNHTTYHRGHVAGMLYQAGAKPPTTDLPVFLREYQPAPAG